MSGPSPASAKTNPWPSSAAILDHSSAIARDRMRPSQFRCGSWLAEPGHRRDCHIAAHGLNLVRELRKLHVQDDFHALAQRPEEVVVVGRNDDLRVEPGQD